MGGGLMQLVAYGAQDIYLTGNPQITFFKTVYRRHTNFSMELVQQSWNGGDNAKKGSTLASTISRNGDLIHRMYLQNIVEKGDTGEGYNPGAYIVDEISVEIGGQQIDKHNGEWLEIYSELTEPNSANIFGLDDSGTTFQDMSGMVGIYFNLNQDQSREYWTPLRFWFNRHIGLALPLIALQYHDVRIILTTYDGSGTATNSNRACCWPNSEFECNLWVEYIYLDTDERRRFAQVSHEYLIEQVQHEPHGAIESMKLNFNHPVKELIWFNGIETLKDYNYQLIFNGQDRISKHSYEYFNKTQVWQHHTGCGGLPRVMSAPIKASFGNIGNNTCVYSFALKPEEHQPSGTCNFSRLDSAVLTQDNESGGRIALDIYAVNYNVLRIMSGMGGLAYSN